MSGSLFDEDFLLESYIIAECAEAEAKGKAEAEAKAKLESEASAKARENEYVLKLLAMKVMSNKDISNVIGIPIGRVEELSKQLIADS